MTSFDFRPSREEVEQRRALYQKEVDRSRGDWDRWELAMEALSGLLAEAGRLAEARALADELATEGRRQAPDRGYWRRALATFHEDVAWSLAHDLFPRGAVLEYLEGLDWQIELPAEERSFELVVKMLDYELARIADARLISATYKRLLEVGVALSPAQREAAAGPGVLSSRERKQLAKIRAVGELHGQAGDAMRLARLEADLQEDLRQAPLCEETLRIGFGGDGLVLHYNYGVAQLDDGSIRIRRLRLSP